MMQLQKKRTSSKKQKPSKSQIPIQMPLAPLLQQINQLKTELSKIKSKKNIKTIPNLNDNSKILNEMPTQLFSPKSDMKLDKIFKINLSQNENVGENKIKEIIFPIRENQLKLNIELTKLNQILLQNNLSLTVSQINKIISYLNQSISKLQLNFHKPNFQTQSGQYQVDNFINNALPFRTQQHHPHQNQNQLYNWKQQVRIYQECNKQLQKQNIEYKHMLAIQNDTIKGLQKANSSWRQQSQQLSNYIAQLQMEEERMKILCVGLRNQRQQLEQKLKIYERTIQKKQSQIVLYQQDLNFTRMQSQKLKIQKRQSQKLLQSLQKQYKQLKSKYQIDTESLIKQKNIFKSECDSRRAQQKQYFYTQQQKLNKNKQIQCLRKQNNILRQQINKTKQKLHEQQTKTIKYQQQNYKLSNENQKYKRSVQYCKLSIKELSEQVQELRQQSSQYKEMVLKNKIGGKFSEKKQALVQIQELIKLHKLTEQNL